MNKINYNEIWDETHSSYRGAKVFTKTIENRLLK